MTTGAEWRTGLTYTRVHAVCSPGVKNKHRQSRAMRAACTSGRQARGQVPTASAGEELWRHSHSLVSGVPDLPRRAKGHYHNDGKRHHLLLIYTTAASAPCCATGRSGVRIPTGGGSCTTALRVLHLQNQIQRVLGGGSKTTVLAQALQQVPLVSQR